jgi:hypothetical protein
VPANPLAPWKEPFTFLPSAERESLNLPASVQRALLGKFPLSARHPWTATPDLDVQPLREMPGRWRLKVEGGHRGVYRSLPGRPISKCSKHEVRSISGFDGTSIPEIESSSHPRSDSNMGFFDSHPKADGRSGKAPVLGFVASSVTNPQH